MMFTREMIWMRRCLAVVAFIYAGLFSRSSFAQSFRTGSGGHLLRKVYTLANNETMQFQTSGCSGSEDTVMALLDASEGVRKTV